MDTFWFYFKEGLFHVLDWNAYDHILFIIVLTVPYTFSSWKRLLSLVTIFTVGHTISLSLSAYDVVKINTTLIERASRCLFYLNIIFWSHSWFWFFNLFQNDDRQYREQVFAIIRIHIRY